MADVSVVIPCFRAGATVGRAVRSAAEQTLPPHEIILVDDGSGPEALETLRGVAASFGALVKVVALEVNSGPGAARNAGWSRAEGAFIALLDADDSWHPRKLEQQMAAMVAHPELVMLGTGSVTLSTPDPLHESVSPGELRRVSPRSLLWSNPFLTSSVLVRANIDARFTEVRTEAEDYDLWLTIVRLGGPAAVLSEPLAFRHKAAFGAGGLSAQLWTMQRKELATLRRLRRAGLASRAEVAGATAWSCVKFARRLMMVGAGRRRGASGTTVALA